MIKHKVTRIRVIVEQGAENWYELSGAPFGEPIACGQGAWAEEHIDLTMMRDAYEHLEEAIVE